MTTIMVPISTLILLLAFAMYGLFLSAVMFAVAVASLVQRRMMHSEVKRYVSLLELANANMQNLRETERKNSNPSNPESIVVFEGRYAPWGVDN